VKVVFPVSYGRSATTGAKWFIDGAAEQVREFFDGDRLTQEHVFLQLLNRRCDSGLGLYTSS
jgi:hypothetical protein